MAGADAGADADRAGVGAAGVVAFCPLLGTVLWFLVAASFAADFAMFVKAESNLDEWPLTFTSFRWSAVRLGLPPDQGAAPQTVAIAVITPAAPATPATAFHFERFRRACRAW